MKTKLSLIGLCISLISLVTAAPNARASCGPDGVAIVPLPSLGGTSLEAGGLNTAGDVTGFSLTAGDMTGHAFLFTANSNHDIGTLGGGFSQGFGLNNFGEVVGEANTAGDLETHAFLYSSNTMTDLGTLGGTYSVGWAINDSGWVVGESLVAGNVSTEAFLATNGILAGLGTLGGTYSSAIAINQAGIIVGDSFTTNNLEYHAFLYTNGMMLDLGTLGGTYSSAYALNESGEVAGEASLTNENVHAFIYSDGMLRDLGTLGGTFSSARALNDLGEAVGIAGTAGDAETHGFLYTGGMMIDLGTFGGMYSEANDINNLGQVVGASTLADGTLRAFILQNATVVDLNTLLPAGSGWELQNAVFINDAGRIVGYGTFNGTFAWFVLDLLSGGDTIAPVIESAPTSVSAVADLNCQAAVPNVLAEIVASDDCTPSDELIRDQNPAAGTLLQGGQHLIAVTIADNSGNSASTNILFTISDTTAPVIISAPVSVAVDASGIVPNILTNVIATDNCTAANQLVLTQSPAAGTLLQPGQNVITVTVADASDNESSRDIPIQTGDTTPPTIHSVTATPALLWPPNGRKVPVSVSVTASDNLDPNPVCRIVSITANRPVPSADIEITGDLTANLAASRKPPGAGRIYTITVECRDASGNSSTATTTVFVPRSNGKAGGKSKR